MRESSEDIQFLGQENLGIFDLVIVGAGCVGTAMAYIAATAHESSSTNTKPKNICLIEKQSLKNPKRYWSSSFSARQNRIQYNQQYLVEYVRKSNQFWKHLQQTARAQFNLTQGALWFGDISASTSEGSIIDADRTLSNQKVSKLYMKNLLGNQPKFLRNWKIDQFKDQRPGHDWQALYSEEGGSINMQKSYNFFLEEIKNRKNVTIKDQTILNDYNYDKTNQVHIFSGFKDKTVSHIYKIQTKNIFIAAGISTPDFIQKVMRKGGQLKEEAIIEQYVASYFKIKQGWQEQYSNKNCPNFYNFLDPTTSYKAGYGFPYHDWDSPVANTIKIGTLAAKKIQNVHIIPKINQITPSRDLIDPQTQQDPRVLANQQYVRVHMNGLEQFSYKNYRCPMIFYEGRETILDYLNRNQKTIVVQTGGWIGKYYPYLAKTAYRLLFDFNGIQYEQQMIRASKIKQQEYEINVMKNFLSRTRYPIRKYVDNKLKYPKNKLQQNYEYDTLIVGAGCSGLYSAFRLNQQKNVSQPSNKKVLPYKIGVFDMLDRISGRLWSVQFQGSKTPMQLGGMRYIEEQHKLLVNMIKKLQMPELPFKMKGDYLQTQSLNCYLRKSRYAQNEWDRHHEAGQKFHTCFRLQEPLIGMNAVQIFSYSIYLILTAEYNAEAKIMLNRYRRSQEYFERRVRAQAQNKWTNYVIQFNLEDWNFLKPILKYKPKPLHNKAETKIESLSKFGFQNIIQNQFSHQVYEYMSNQNGYYSLTSNESYIQHIVAYLLDFGPVTYKTLAGGFDMFNYNIANALLDQNKGISANGGGIYLKQQLVYIEKKSDWYFLTFQNKDTLQRRAFKAKNIILGMPRRSIERLYQKIDILRKPISYRPQQSLYPKNPNNLIELIGAVKNMPSIKIIMNFKTNWWDFTKNNPEFSTGQQMRGVSSTDLPIRQTLYFGTDTDNMILASYNDKNTTDYWSVLQDNFEPFEPFDDIPLSATRARYVGSGKRSRLCHKKIENISPASYQVVHEVLRQLRVSHGQAEGIDQSNVKQAMYQNWAQDPFGGGYHFWNPGYDVKKVMQTVRKPWNGENGTSNQNIFIVGEAFSNATGWVQGALQVTEKMLEDHFKLKQYFPGYYKGW